MTGFRIMPAQRIERQTYSGLRYGVRIAGHPLQDPKAGFYLASWATWGEAQIAAFCLGYPMTAVEPVNFIAPSDVNRVVR